MKAITSDQRKHLALMQFVEQCEKRGLATREYQGDDYVESLWECARTVWKHMCTLDLTNLRGWEPFAPLANAYAASQGNGLKRFGKEEN